MLYLNEYFNNYTEFKAFFKNSDGRRQNAVILSFIKYAMKNNRKYPSLGCWTLCKRCNLDDVYMVITCLVHDISRHENVTTGWSGKARYCVHIEDMPTFYHDTIGTDGAHGICEDRDVNQVRFLRYMTDEQLERSNQTNNDGHVYKKKAGKLLREIIELWMPDLNEAVMNYVCEAFANKWRAARVGDSSRYELHIDKDFCSIYAGSEAVQECRVTGSCMRGKDQYKFYEDCVKAHAAYLTDAVDDNAIVARCVIFDEVHAYNEQDDKTYRYSERIYSKAEELSLKELLLHKLISGKHVDLYKEATAGCWDKTRIRKVEDGELIEDTLYVKCYADEDSTISFQDTFGYYDMGVHKAYNKNVDVDYIDLSTTDESIETEYDSYHDRNCRRATTVYVWNDYHNRYREETCDEDDMDDFTWSEADERYYDDGVWVGDELYGYNSVYICRTVDDDWMLKDDCVKIDVDWYDKDSDDIVKIGDEWYLKDDCTTLDEDEYTIIDGVLYMAA